MEQRKTALTDQLRCTRFASELHRNELLYILCIHMLVLRSNWAVWFPPLPCQRRNGSANARGSPSKALNEVLDLCWVHWRRPQRVLQDRSHCHANYNTAQRWKHMWGQMPMHSCYSAHHLVTLLNPINAIPANFLQFIQGHTGLCPPACPLSFFPVDYSRIMNALRFPTWMYSLLFHFHTFGKGFWCICFCTPPIQPNRSLTASYTLLYNLYT